MLNATINIRATMEITNDYYGSTTRDTVEIDIGIIDSGIKITLVGEGDESLIPSSPTPCFVNDAPCFINDASDFLYGILRDNGYVIDNQEIDRFVASVWKQAKSMSARFLTVDEPRLKNNQFQFEHYAA